MRSYEDKNNRNKTNRNKTNRNKTIRHFRELEVYQKAFNVAMRIYEITKSFPSEEKYSLTDQIRRSSRSVCSNIGEAWRKRKYGAVFRNKMTDAMQEASESQTWLDFCLACKYIDDQAYKELDDEYEQIILMLNSMERKAESFCF
ncbi:MAG: four helix bundle protein [Nitrospirae bacterium]|nr:four helix bundle protein [Nitrospirota bacterium]